MNSIKKKKAYFIGIAGKTTGAIAKAFKDMGWEVSGSDHVGVYPPVSTYLKENNILYIEDYRAENVPPDADLVVVGRSAMMIDLNNPEYLRAKELGLRVLSHPEALREFVVKKNSIVVAGTYGKTTISALLAWILIKAGLNPAYMTGGVSVDLGDGVKITDSEYSVVEGDEPPSLFETDPPKFMFYDPRFLLLTATIHDHPEIYKTPADYLSAFIKLVKKLPQAGLLIYNLDNVGDQVTAAFSGKKISYSLTNPKADYFLAGFTREGSKTKFEIKRNDESLSLETTLLGRHNLENICGAVALSREMGIDSGAIAEAVKSFRGIKTRLEFLGEIGGRLLYWDFAQHPKKVKSSLSAIKESYPESRVICVFDPTATALKHKESLVWYPEAFDAADQVIVGKVSFLKSIDKEGRVTGSDIVKTIGKTQKNVFYQPLNEKIIDWLGENSREGDVIVFMSSGGMNFVNLINNTKKAFSV
jgi:UDP-N-acetylmuramate: L-alanyl-gamma-D-glutamyl-meso-diaminopimelate ligase